MSIWTARDDGQATHLVTAQQGAVVLFACGLLWPLAYVIFNAVSLTAFYEESIGYRYFYTLRQLYEPEYLFLPQGQSANLIFKCVHAALNLFGFPPTQIRPRIDYFCIISIAILQLANIGAFSRLLKQNPGSINPFLAALFWLLPAYALGPATGYVLLMPDYLALEPAIAMLSAGLLLKAYSEAPWTGTNSLWLGVLLGLAFATKVTLAIFPGITILFLALNSARPLRELLIGAVAFGASLLVWIILICSDVGFNPRRFISYVFELHNFISTGGGMGTPPQSWFWWIWARGAAGPAVVSFIYLTPLLGVATLAFARDRRSLAFLASLLVGAGLYSVILYRRDYYVTLIEAGFYAFMFAWCVWSAASTGRRSFAGLKSKLVEAAAASLLLLLGAHNLYQYVMSTLPAIEQSAAAERELEKLNQRIAGQRLWLVPDNYSRPIAIESAIMKGGSNAQGVWLEPDSAIIRRAVPNLEFRFERNDSRPVSLDDYAAVFFVSKEDLKHRLQDLNKRYRIDLFQLRCNGVLQMETGTLVMCVHAADHPS